MGMSDGPGELQQLAEHMFVPTRAEAITMSSFPCCPRDAQ